MGSKKYTVTSTRASCHVYCIKHSVSCYIYYIHVRPSLQCTYLCTCTVAIGNVLISGILENRVIIVEIYYYDIHDDGVFVSCIIDGYSQSEALVRSGVVIV